MSLFGSLATGVSALTAQSQSLGMISNNIANVNTVGYKRVDADFSSLVTAESRASRYTPGSVNANTVGRVTEQGGIRQTNTGTDMAISGSGFFPVQRTNEGSQETLYTRAGAFSEDKEGFLTNTSGFYLMGWALDQNGDFVENSIADLSSLTPIDLSSLGGVAQSTSNAELAMNLNSEEDEASYPLGTNAANDFSRGLRVYDSLGGAQDVSVEFYKVQSPTANAVSVLGTDLELTTNLNAVPINAAVPSDITFTVDGENINFVSDANSTVFDLIDTINASTGLRARLNESAELLIQAIDTEQDITIVDNVGDLSTALSLTNTAAPAAPTILYSGGLENSGSNANHRGWWEMRVVHPNGTDLTSGLINFNTDGSINAIKDADNEIKVEITDINWDNGTDITQDIDFQIDSLSQFAGQYNVISTSQNGAALGLRTGIEIDRDGFVTARFSNGQATQLYKLPLVTFANANGLTEVTGNAYTESSTSGDFNLREAGSGGAGLIEGSSVETSNVDLAEEFTKLIVTQRAYSAGTKIITTADELTEELLRLR